ncbi:MAG: helix-turn-helix domain-containing protein [Chloroflexi bacterium]|nr:helix-turn-helix domain-containing protein [Chloroflexota bacterium]
MDAAEKRRERKKTALRAARALNGRPATVSDAAFTSGNPFFDPADLVQVKYEMVRRVRAEGQKVGRSAAAFGFSRPAWYQAAGRFDREGLVGLLPLRPGPRRAHKLREEVVDLLERALEEEPSLRPADLAARVSARFGLRVHPRSVERALKRRRKKWSQGSTPQ